MLSPEQKAQLKDFLLSAVNSSPAPVSMTELVTTAKTLLQMGKSQDGSYDLPDCLSVREAMNELCQAGDVVSSSGLVFASVKPWKEAGKSLKDFLDSN